jgi:gas vesicle protein
MSKSSTNALLGFIAGATAGAALGVLFAPDKGSKTRKRIKNEAEKIGDDVRDSLSSKIDDLNDYVGEFVKEAKSRFSTLEEKVKKEAKDVKEKATK